MLTVVIYSKGAQVKAEISFLKVLINETFEVISDLHIAEGVALILAPRYHVLDCVVAVLGEPYFKPCPGLVG